MASNVRQNRTLEAIVACGGLPEASFASKNEVTSDFCLAPIFIPYLLVGTTTATVARTASRCAGVKIVIKNILNIVFLD